MTDIGHCRSSLCNIERGTNAQNKHCIYQNEIIIFQVYEKLPDGLKPIAA